MQSSTLERSIHENVLPWIFDRVDEFLVDDASIMNNTFEMVERGVRGP